MQNSEEIETKQISLWKIAFSRDCDPEKVKNKYFIYYQEDLFQILYWLKQLIGLIIGILAGYYHFEGIVIMIGFILFDNIIKLVLAFYLSVRLLPISIVKIFLALILKKLNNLRYLQKD